MKHPPPGNLLPVQLNLFLTTCPAIRKHEISLTDMEFFLLHYIQIYRFFTDSYKIQPDICRNPKKVLTFAESFRHVLQLYAITSFFPKDTFRPPALLTTASLLPDKRIDAP